jgi:hypothetical protein
MKPKAGRAKVSVDQLELPLGRQGGGRDLAWYIGLCKVFAAYHKRWPTIDSTREEFRAARVPGYDGRRLDRELRSPGPELEADPAHQVLRERCLADGAEGVTLEALDPRYRTVMQDQDIAELFATIALPGRAQAGAVRYATGAPAHAREELTLQLGEALRARALRRAGLDPDDPRVLAHGFSARVRATEVLKSILDRAGSPYPHAGERLADDYLLEASDEGRLQIRYQLLEGSRHAGRFDVGELTARLASLYAADPALARLRGSAPLERPDAPAVLAAIAAAPRPHSDEELREQLAMLEPEGQCLKLPIQQLSRFDDIRRALEKAGATYRSTQQRFEFEEGVDPAGVLEQLLSGGAP